MINIYNETQLHRTLKNLYSTEDAVQEVEIAGCICDIYSRQGIIEIQTTHISALKNKLKKLLPLHPITIIYPIIENSYILTLNADSSRRSYRKSPKHGSFYQIFKELLGIAEYIEHPHFSLEIVYVDCEIIKIDDKQGKSRYKKPRILDKKLLKIHRRQNISNLETLISPLMENIPSLFISTDVRKLGTGIHTSYIISFLKRTKKIIYCTKAGRYHVYKKTGA